jgi:hypothetical protein
MLIDDNTGTFNMTEIKSYQSYMVDENPWVDEDRPSLGSALLVVMGLLFLGWAAILAPLVAIFH